jgi:hypothetical protein
MFQRMGINKNSKQSSGIEYAEKNTFCMSHGNAQLECSCQPSRLTKMKIIVLDFNINLPPVIAPLIAAACALFNNKFISNRSQISRAVSYRENKATF